MGTWSLMSVINTVLMAPLLVPTVPYGPPSGPYRPSWPVIITYGKALLKLV